MPDSRQPVFNVPSVVVALLVVIVVIHAVRTWLLPVDLDRNIIATFAFVPARFDSNAFIDGMLPGGYGAKFWTFVTYALLHADATHLGVNAVWLLAFASPVARRFGAVRFLVLVAVCAAAGALAHLLAHGGELTPMIGASASVSGAMAAATRFAFEPGGPLDVWSRDREEAGHMPAAPLSVALRNPRVVTFLAVWFGLNLLFGLGSISLAGEDQSVAWEAHVGGFLAGLLLFSAIDPIERPPSLDRTWQ